MYVRWLDDPRGENACAATPAGWLLRDQSIIIPIGGTTAQAPVSVQTSRLRPWIGSAVGGPMIPSAQEPQRPAIAAHTHNGRKRPAISDPGTAIADVSILRPTTTDATSAPSDIVLGEITVTIPRANQTLRAKYLSQGSPGWSDRAIAIAVEADRALQRQVEQDALLNKQQMSKPYRLRHAAAIVPFLPLHAVQKALGIGSATNTDPTNMLRLMLDYICRWNVSTISGAASAWFRHQYLCKHLNLPADQHFDGPTFTALFKSVTVKAKVDAAKTAEAGKDSRRNGTTAETQVRNGLYFIHRNCGLGMPALESGFVKKMKWTGRHAPDPFLMIPVKALASFERAAAEITPDLPPIVRDYSSIFFGMGMASLRAEQGNCSEITSETHLIDGCFAGMTDTEKSNEPHKMLQQCFLMPAQGFLEGELGQRWHIRFMNVTRPVQLAGILIRENDSKHGDPFEATRVFNRPMDPRRVATCFHALLHRVGQIPKDRVHLYGISSLRKFLTSVGKHFRLPPDHLNEIGRWSESSAKNAEFRPSDRVQGQFAERVSVMTTKYSLSPTTKWVAGILTSLTAAIRFSIARVGFENFPVEGSDGGLELVLQSDMNRD